MTSDNWKQAALFGAAGKMGKGIALLLLELVAEREDARLVCIDSNMPALKSLKSYLREHLIKNAERRINALRKRYAGRHDLIDNMDIIAAYCSEALERTIFATCLEAAIGSDLVFEAIVEDESAKVNLFRDVDSLLKGRSFFFSNTSSIPIHILQSKSGLEGRLIGYHFYNPPAIQKLLEVVMPRDISCELKEIALGLADKFKKKVVFSRDVAGFIGNGFLMQEIRFACEQVHLLSKTMPLVAAIANVNKITEHYLVRPMGIFQLIDYVGIDVCKKIGAIMAHYLQSHCFGDPLIDGMVDAGIFGGQHGNGSQKDGFFSYEKGAPVGVYDLSQRKYVVCPEEYLVGLPSGYLPWKKLAKDPKRAEALAQYFAKLSEDPSWENELALAFLKNELKIAQGLVKDDVAASLTDVDAVLQEGFFHLYGACEPLNVNNLRIMKP